MTLKQYQTIRIVFAMIIAIIFSQSIILENYYLPIITLAVAWPLLFWLRRRVKEVIADERDYVTGGKSAMLAMQIYSMVAVVAMFILYGARALNPAYEPVAMTLAYSTCILMLLYAVIFRYYDKFKFSDKKFIFSALILVFFLLLAIFTLRLFSGEDNWICQNGQWIKHGSPDFPAPTTQCK